MDRLVFPAELRGNISAIPSKSDAHRLLICAALSDSPTVLRLSAESEDIDATRRCLSALGAKFSRSGDLLTVHPITEIPDSPVLDCGESGSTLRFMLPVAAALCPCAHFTGRGRLPLRPLGELTDVMEAHGVSFSSPKLPFTVSGRLTSGRYSLPGNVSSQYITGLLLALSTVPGESEIVLTTPLESAAYVDITLSALKKFGTAIEKNDSGWKIPQNKRISSPRNLCVDGDWSNGAFFLSAGALGHRITVTGLDVNSPQGDKAILTVLSRFGAETKIDGNSITVTPSELRGCTVDMREIPDLMPILAVVAANAKGTTHFVNAARLRLKESDRISTTAKMLRALGISVTEEADGLIVEGGEINGGNADGANDHRIVMASAIAATIAKNEVRISDSEAVNKSYPTFFEDLESLGGISRGI